VLTVSRGQLAAAEGFISHHRSRFVQVRSSIDLRMALIKHGRRYDLVVFGATGRKLPAARYLTAGYPNRIGLLTTMLVGYTGKLTAEHIATHLPSTLKWALAGRSETKLRELVSDCKEHNPDRVPPG
jgi:hypothetical protein